MRIPKRREGQSLYEVKRSVDCQHYKDRDDPCKHKSESFFGEVRFNHVDKKEGWQRKIIHVSTKYPLVARFQNSHFSRKETHTD